MRAISIARSVTEGRRYQSYIASNGPSWLSREIAMDVGGGPLRSFRRKLLDALKSIVTTAFGLYDHPALSLLISGAGSLRFYFRRLLVVFLVLSKLYTLVMVLGALVSCPVYLSIISINIQC